MDSHFLLLSLKKVKHGFIFIAEKIKMNYFESYFGYNMIHIKLLHRVLKKNYKY